MFRIKKERGKIVALFAAAVFVLSTFIATATPFLAQAAPVTYGNLTQDEKLKVLLRFLVLVDIATSSKPTLQR
jgi:hypothetical protein